MPKIEILLLKLPDLYFYRYTLQCCHCLFLDFEERAQKKGEILSEAPQVPNNT